MLINTLTGWIILACAGAVHAAAGIVEIDLAFPRNQSYAPTSLLPFTFALQNPTLATPLNLHVAFSIRDWRNISAEPVRSTFDISPKNHSSSEPFFVYRPFTGFNKEGHWVLTWTLAWDSCTEASLSNSSSSVITSYESHNVSFTTEESAPGFDITRDTQCNDWGATAINITELLGVPRMSAWNQGDTCPVVALSSPAPDPCQVQINSDVVANASFAIDATACERYDQGLDPEPAGGCSARDEESGARRLVAVTTRRWAIGLGMAVYMFM